MRPFRQKVTKTNLTTLFNKEICTPTGPVTFHVILGAFSIENQKENGVLYLTVLIL